MKIIFCLLLDRLEWQNVAIFDCKGNKLVNEDGGYEDFNDSAFNDRFRHLEMVLEEGRLEDHVDRNLRVIKMKFPSF